MIVIDNFEMPKDCNHCPLLMKFMVSYDDPIGCVLTHQYRTDLHGRRPIDCSLRELDELIDDLK